MFPETIEAKDQSVWATMIPNRKPEFKVHRTEGLANSAMSSRGTYEGYAKYELVDGAWHLRFSYTPRKNCDRCGREYRLDYLNDRQRDTTYKGAGYLARVICRDCYNSDLDKKRAKEKEDYERAQLERLKAKYE